MKKLSVILFVILGLVFAGYAEAAKPKKRSRNANRIGAYGGLLAGQSNYSEDQSETEAGLRDGLISFGNPLQNLRSSTKDSDVGYQATFGYRFSRFFAAELGLVQFGSLSTSARADMDFGNGFVPTSLTLTFKPGGPLFSAVGILPFNDKLELYGRLGYLFTSSRRELSSRVDGQSASYGGARGESQNPVYGVGFAWNLSQVYSIRGEFQKIDDLGQKNRTGTEDMTVIGLGLMVRF
jgi:OOP family OmpA-OmpF porin